MSFLKDVSAKSLYIANEKLLQTIFNHPPELPNGIIISLQSDITSIHKIIKDDLAGTCTVVISDHTKRECLNFNGLQLFNRFRERSFSVKIAKPYNPSISRGA